MSIDEFAKEVAERIRRGYNLKDRAAVFSAINEAENALEHSKVGNAARSDFWKQTFQYFRSGQLLMEKQEGSALHQLMRDIERDLAQRQAHARDSK